MMKDDGTSFLGDSESVGLFPAERGGTTHSRMQPKSLEIAPPPPRDP